MERYNEYKDSSVQWLGEIPSHWECEKAKRHFQSRKQIVGRNSSQYERLALTLKGVIKRFEGDGVGLNPEKLDTYQIVDKDDLIFKLIDLENVSTSRVGLSPYKGIVSPAYIRISAVDEVNIRFAEYYYLNMWMRHIFNDLGTPGVRSNLSSTDLLNLPLLYPSIVEQKAIATYLDKATAKIDETIAQQQKMIDLLNERKQIIINNAVTKGLNPDAPMKDSGVEWIGEIPEHWEVMPIKRLKSKEKNAFVDGPFGSNLKSEHFVENGDVYVIESGLITTGKYVHRELKTITKSHFETIKRSECKANDIIIAKIGARFGMAGELPELGKPCVVSGNSLKLTLDQSVMQNGMFVNYMGLAKWKGGFVGLYQETAQPALSLGALNNMMLPVPPIEEQLYILEQTNQKLDILDVAIINASKQISLLQERKQIIINDVVTGKVKVS